VVGPLEAFGWIAFAAEEEIFPWIVSGDAGHAGELALISNRNDRVAGGRADHHVDLVTVDELRRDFRCTVRVRLAVAVENFHRMLFAGDRDAIGQGLFDLGNHPLIGFAECSNRSGLRADHADLDGLARRPRRLKHPR
jgi:hypothetical protein